MQFLAKPLLHHSLQSDGRIVLVLGRKIVAATFPFGHNREDILTVPPRFYPFEWLSPTNP